MVKQAINMHTTLLIFSFGKGDLFLERSDEFIPCKISATYYYFSFFFLENPLHKEHFSPFLIKNSLKAVTLS